MSGQLIGQVIGFYFFGPIGGMIGGMIGGALFPAEGPDGPRLGDLAPQKSEYGSPIPIVYGTVALGGNVIWASDLIEVEGDSGGGKGGSESTVYSYFGNFAVAVCEGQKTLGRIWAGPEKRLIYDGTILEGEGDIRYYNGSEDQLPDPLIESYEGVGTTPAYRGTAYVVLENFPLAKDGNRLPFLTIETCPTSVNTALENLGIFWVTQLLVTDDYWATFYHGSYYGIIIRSKSDNSLVDHFQFTIAQWELSATWFYDEARNTFVQAIPGSLNYRTIPIGSGLITTHTIEAPVGADANLGSEFVGGVEQNGAYVFAAKGSSGQVDRVSLYGVNPDTHECEWAYAANSGAAGAASKVMAPVDDTSPWLYVWSSPNKLTLHHFSPAAAVLDLGAATAVAAGAWGIDPDGYIWTVSDGAGTFDWSKHDPVLAGAWPTPAPGLVDSGTETFNGTFASNPLVFAGSEVIVAGEEWLGRDLFYVFNPVVAEDPYLPRYHGTMKVEAMWWNASTEALYVVRDGGGVTVSGYSPEDITAAAAEGVTLVPTDRGYDPYTSNRTPWIPPIPQNHGYGTSESDSFYMGEGDATGTGIPEGELLSAVLTALHLRAGLAADQIGVSRLVDETVDGYAIATQTTVREAIAALMPAYFFDAVESDGKVEFVSRGGDIAVVIPDDDVGSFESGSDPVDPIETTRRMENELPRTMHVRYLLAATNYSTAAKLAKRLVGASGEERTMDLPLVLTDTKAQEIAEVNLHGAWVARLTYSFTLPRKYSYLEPTDIIVVYGYTMRLTKTVNVDGIIKCEATHDDSNVYVPNVVVTETTPDDQVVSTPTEIILELM